MTSKEEWRQAAFLEAEAGEDEIVIPQVLQIVMPLSF